MSDPIQRMSHSWTLMACTFRQGAECREDIITYASTLSSSFRFLWIFSFFMYSYTVVRDVAQCDAVWQDPFHCYTPKHRSWGCSNMKCWTVKIEVRQGKIWNRSCSTRRMWRQKNLLKRADVFVWCFFVFKMSNVKCGNCSLQTIPQDTLVSLSTSLDNWKYVSGIPSVH